MDGLKIIIVTSEFVPVKGGIGTYVKELARNLPKTNDVLVLAPYDEKAIAGSINGMPENITVHRIGKAGDGLYNNLRYQLACKKELLDAISQFKPDIIHSQSTMPDLFVNPKKIGVPIVTTVHSTIKGQNDALRSAGVASSIISPSERSALFMSSFIQPIENSYYKKRNHFITVSKYCAERFSKNWNKKREEVKIIPNGVDLEIFNPSIKKENTNYPALSAIEFPNVLFLSRLVGIKGLDILIDSIDKVNKRAEVMFLIAGSGSNSKLDSIKANNVVRLGYVPHDQASDLYAQSDIFVLPSYHENCPLSLLEAMSSGLAVIATKVGGIHEIIENEVNGLLISNDGNELAEAIVRLTNDSALRKKLGEEARKTVERSFSWKMAASMTDLYYREVMVA